MTTATQQGRGIATAVSMLVLAAGTLRADTWRWIGGSGTSWDTAANWAGGTVPANDGTATVAITNFNGTVDLAANRDIDTLLVGGPTGVSMTLQHGTATLTIRGALRREWPVTSTGATIFDCKLALGADGVRFYNNYGGNNYFYYPITDNGNGFDWIIDGGMDMRDSGTKDQPSGFSGRTLLKRGALYIRADHAFTSCSEWVVSGSLYASDANVRDKLGNEAPIRLYDGQLAWAGGSEDVGPVSLASGATSIRAGTGTLQANSLARGSSTPGTLSLCRIENGVGTTAYVKFDSTAGLGLVGGDGSRTTNKKIAPFLYDWAAAGNQMRTLHTYEAVNGLVPLAIIGDFVHATGATFPAVNADGNDNVLLRFTEAGSATITLTGNATVNSLVVYVDDVNASHFLDLGGFTLTIKSGVLIANNDLSSNNDRFQINNGTIDTGAAEMVLYSTMGAANNGLDLMCNLTGTGGVTVHSASSAPANFLGTGANLKTVNLMECNDLRVYENAFATNAIVVGVRDSFAVNRNILRAYGTRLIVGEAHGNLVLMPGRNTSNGDPCLLIGGTAANHVNNHVRLLGAGVLSPHGTTLSDPDQTQLDGGVIAMSAYDTAATIPGEEFTVDLHGGQVVIDLFGTANYDQLRVVTSTYVPSYSPRLSLNAGNGTGSELVVRLHYAPTPADSFTIVEVAGSSAIIGKFSNGDKATATFGTKKYQFDVQYNVGADGNDIVLANAVAQANGTVLTIR